MRLSIGIAGLLMLSPMLPALASGTIYYGSRAGMEVDVISVEGLSTNHAIIRTKHTRGNAIAFCREYVQNVTEECIQTELSIPLNDVITADCPAGIFTDFRGNKWHFLGPNPQKGTFAAKYRLVYMQTGEVADGSSASGYPVAMGIFKALCPAQAPSDED
jgi:hypothetical protein